MQPIDNVLSLLEYEDAGDNQWNAVCPCRNDDDNPSLRVAVGDQGQVLMNCRRGGGCNLEQICSAIQVDVKDLWPKEGESGAPAERKSGNKRNKNLKLTQTYPYLDEDGTLVFQVLRYVDKDTGKKTFRQRQPDGTGDWVWNTANINKPLYRLPYIRKGIEDGDTLYVVEGEKDADTLVEIGLNATTNAGGASDGNKESWTHTNTMSLKGAQEVCIISDNDLPGKMHAAKVAKMLHAEGIPVKVYKPVGEYKDITDALDDNVPFESALEYVGAPKDEPIHDYEPDDYENYDSNVKEDYQPSPLNTLISDLTRLSNSGVPHNKLLGQVSSSFDAFASEEADQFRDPGIRVHWRPFLEENVDLSYDWVIPNLLERQERVIVVAAEGAGKRATISSMIPTPTGYTKLGDIQVGDQVFDRFGNVVNVTYVSPVEQYPDSYRVHFSDDTYVDCDAEHNWYTETINEREKRKLGAVRTTAEIRDTLISNRSSKALNHAVPTTEPLQLPEANLLVDPYTLGVWLGDGNSGNAGVSNADSDKQIIARVSGSYEVRLRESSVQNGKVPMWGILGLQAQLRELGILGNKRIPMQYLRSSHGQRLALLQGLMDTDGTIDTRGRSEFCVSNKALAGDAHELLMTFGIKATVKESDSVLNGETVGKRYRVHFVTDLPVFSLQRKADRVKPLRTPRSKYRYITAVEKIDPEPMLCISVDGPDNTYLIGDSFIPTHNTTLARQVALMSAAGIHPFKREPMKPVRTLMVDLENPDRIIRRAASKIYSKIKDYGLHEEMDAHLLLKPDGVNLMKGEDRMLIEQHVSEVEPDILFFGPLYKAFIDPGGRTAESISTEIARFLDYIRHTYNCALWIEHHAPLGSGGTRDLRPFGSAVWSRWSEFGLALAPDPTDPNLIEFRHYRGQREQREWPTICRRGATWPFEAIEFQAFDATIAPAGDGRTEEEMTNAYLSDEFDESRSLW